MAGYSISQVAERTGFAPSALRFYEQVGLVSPDRTASGYRSYDDHHIEVLQFVGRAKAFGLTLDEVTEVLELLADDHCEPLQSRLRVLVTQRIAEAQGRVAELVAFTAELKHVAASLSLHTPDGPCDSTCGCTSGPSAGPAPGPVRLTSGSAVPADPRVACTLSPTDRDQRLADWRDVVGASDGVEAIEDGIRLVFSSDVEVAEVAALAAAEQSCCPFFTFTLTIGAFTTLDITGPPAVLSVIDSLVGAPS